MDTLLGFFGGTFLAVVVLLIIIALVYFFFFRPKSVRKENLARLLSPLPCNFFDIGYPINVNGWDSMQRYIVCLLLNRKMISEKSQDLVDKILQWYAIRMEYAFVRQIRSRDARKEEVRRRKEALDFQFFKEHEDHITSASETLIVSAVMNRSTIEFSIRNMKKTDKEVERRKHEFWLLHRIFKKTGFKVFESNQDYLSLEGEIVYYPSHIFEIYA